MRRKAPGLTRRAPRLRYRAFPLTPVQRTVTTQRAAPPEKPPETQPRGEPPKSDPPPPPGPGASQVTNRQLVAWMFRFLRPVKGLVILACLYLSLWVAAEVL